MTGRRRDAMGHPGDGSAGRDQEFGDLASVAERLETYASHASPMPSEDFSDRVMAAVRREPAPTPARSFLRALAAFSPVLVARAFRANVRVLTGTSRMPLAIRAQALAVVMLGVLVVGTGGGLAAAGAAALLRGADASPAPSPVPSLDAMPTGSLSASASPSPIAQPTECRFRSGSHRPGDRLSDGYGSSHADAHR